MSIKSEKITANNIKAEKITASKIKTSGSGVIPPPSGNNLVYQGDNIVFSGDSVVYT